MASKARYEVYVFMMDGTTNLSFPKGQPEQFNSCGEADNWALEMSDSDKIRFAKVVEIREVRTFKGKGLLIEEARKARGEDEGGGLKDREPGTFHE